MTIIFRRLFFDICIILFIISIVYWIVSLSSFSILLYGTIFSVFILAIMYNDVFDNVLK